MKIMIMSDLAPPSMGGIETYVTQLGTHLTKLGCEVHWLTSKISDTREYENYQGIHIHRIPILFSKKFLFPGRQTFPFMATLQKLDFIKDMDVVHANTLTAGYSGWRIARKYNKPSLLFCHEFLGDLWKTIGQNVLEKKIYPMMEKRIARAQYDWYACPSEYSKSTLISAGAPKDKITVIPHGIDHDKYNASADATYFRNKFGLQWLKLFGYLGRLRIKKTAQSKNLTMLLEAAKIVVRNVPDARLVLAGAGYEELKPLIKRLEIQHHVIYLGNIPYTDNPRFLRTCDLVVCPAWSDGFCFLLAQASACGVPVVATNVGAHSERIINGKTGVLTESSPQSLADSIVGVLCDANKAQQLASEAQRYSVNFTWEKSAQKHIEIYEKLIQNRD
jgi:glycosyltransferase involved in cell wall biosynthesis